MEKIIINIYSNYKLHKTEFWEDTKENIFKDFYETNNSWRYCNGSHLEFENKKLEKEYHNWLNSLSETTRFKMYYGNGVVD